MFHDFFKISRQTVPVGKPTAITLSARFASQLFFERGELVLKFLNSNSLTFDQCVPLWRQYDTVPFEVVDRVPGTIRFEVSAACEGEMRFLLAARKNDMELEVCQFGIYALKDDLLDLHPYRGDFHVHSNSSECAFQDEDPLHVAAIGRLKGLDFITFTDHMQMDTGKAVAEFWREAAPEYQIFAAEEVHQLKSKQKSLYRRNNFLPGVHIINFGGSWSVSALENDQFERYTAEIAGRADQLDHKLSPDVRKIVAGADWIIDKIHESGGMAIYCHPYWKPHNRYDMPTEAREAIFKNNKFDAVEIIGLGTSDKNSLCRESNNQAVARWQSACIAAGRMLPVTGATDSHNSRNNLGRQYSIVLAEDCTMSSIKKAVIAGNSVAVMAHDNEERRVYGNERITEYVNFLLREYYPLHDELCALEGLEMLKKLRETAGL